MIATAFIDQTSNELWEELHWLEGQPITDENGALYDQILEELRTRERRRQNLEDHFAWG
jgi:hypothetical protein